MVECLLESGKHSTVVFKFSPDVDKTDDIADSLVSLGMCVSACWFNTVNTELQHKLTV